MTEEEYCIFLEMEKSTASRFALSRSVVARDAVHYFPATYHVLAGFRTTPENKGKEANPSKTLLDCSIKSMLSVQRQPRQQLEHPRPASLLPFSLLLPNCEETRNESISDHLVALREYRSEDSRDVTSIEVRGGEGEAY